jgi:hypothetical protein
MQSRWQLLELQRFLDQRTKDELLDAESVYLSTPRYRQKIDEVIVNICVEFRGQCTQFPLRFLEQVLGVAVPLLGLRSWFLSLQGALQASLQRFDEGVRTKRGACAGASAHQIPEIRSVGLADKRLPNRDQLQQWAHAQEAIVLSSKVCPSARPRPILRLRAETRPHRVALYVPCRCKYMSLIHHKGGKALMPEVYSPTRAEVDQPRIRR